MRRETRKVTSKSVTHYSTAHLTLFQDVCKVTIFYSDRMCAKVAEKAVGESAYANARRFVVNSEQCLAINNIDNVLNFIRPFAVKDLGIDDVLGALHAVKGDVVVRSCRRTLMTLVQNAVENVENKIYEVLEGIGSKMAPVIQRFMVEGTARYRLLQCLLTRNICTYLGQ